MRASLYAVAILALAITVMWGGAQFNTTTVVEASGGTDAPAATFPGTGTGAIPDNAPTNPLNISFNVTGLSGTPTAISVSMTATHTWVGDLTATLVAPNGTSHVLFGRTGTTSANTFGSSSDLGGTYVFNDAATGTNWWAAAVTNPVAPGSYRTTQPGPQPAANFSPVTSIDTSFAGVTNPNGTWTLRISDNAQGDTGSVTAASLTLVGGTPPPPPTPAQFLDFFGNNLTDFAIFTFPTTGGQLRWTIAKNDNPTTATSNIIDQPWGQTSTDIVPNFGNWVGDRKTDFNIYRNNSGSPANTYQILANNTPAVGGQTYINWGNSTSDIIGREGDYNGDGLMDPTAIRSPDPVNGGPLTWYILNSGSNTLTAFVYGTSVTDIPLPGADYNGDGRDDPTVVRIAGNGLITWLVGTTNGTLTSATNWGSFNTDFIIPGGDYDGDNKADFMVWRGFGAGTNGAWYLKTATGAESSVVFGIPGGAGRDTALRGGDYDGDGKDDIAVYRPGSRDFIVRYSTSLGTVIQNWGVPGNTNLPMASFGTF